MSDVIFSEEQERAIDKVVKWFGTPGVQEFYLAGFAGVGKSTIANEAIERIKRKYSISRINTAAYTGKAAAVLRKKGVSNAQTIHSLIYAVEEDEETGEISFVLSEMSAAASAQLIVLDECSMVDEKIADDLRSFKKKILIMGDPGQLPPINGQGSFTNREPDAFLKEIHRQAGDSPILELATMARQGIRIPSDYKKGDVSVQRLTKQTSELIHNPNTQVICGLNKVRWTATQMMRSALLYKGNEPIVGERIICCRNDNEIGVYNGALGILDKLDYSRDGNKRIYMLDVTLDDLPKYHSLETDPYLFERHFNNGTSQKIPKRRYQEFDWGYVLTCHKSQGSSWDHVTVIDDSGSFRDDQAKWLYTAITRAETGLTLLTRK